MNCCADIFCVDYLLQSDFRSIIIDVCFRGRSTEYPMTGTEVGTLRVHTIFGNTMTETERVRINFEKIGTET